MVGGGEGMTFEMQNVKYFVEIKTKKTTITAILMVLFLQNKNKKKKNIYLTL